MDVNVVHPTSATTCDVTFHWWVEGHRLHEGDYIEDSIRASDAVQQEDIALCESVQRGLQSVGFRHGRYAPSHEQPMLCFHELLHDFYVSSGVLDGSGGSLPKRHAAAVAI